MKIVRFIEINVAAKQATLVLQLDPTRTRTIGTFPASITADKITWTQTTTRGRASSTTTYTLIRKSMAFNIHIDYNAFMDQDPWDQTSQCKAG
jgi:hypothetical protein